MLDQYSSTGGMKSSPEESPKPAGPVDLVEEEEMDVKAAKAQVSSIENQSRTSSESQ